MVISGQFFRISVKIANFRISFYPCLLLVVCSVFSVYLSVVVVCCRLSDVGCRGLTVDGLVPLSVVVVGF